MSLSYLFFAKKSQLSLLAINIMSLKVFYRNLNLKHHNKLFLKQNLRQNTLLGLLYCFH